MIIPNLKKIAKENDNFRRVVYTGTRSQVVLMSLAPGEDIGSEVHPSTDQILYIVGGEGQAVINGQTSEIDKYSLIYVNAGTRHNIINTGDDEMKLYTIYSPPAHADGTIHVTKEDAEREEGEEERGLTNG